MEKQQCLGGGTGSEAAPSPLPVIGVYITASSLVCLLLLLCDVLQGFRQKKLWFPCRKFGLNSFTLSLLGIATKLPADLTSSMPRAEDQLSKLCGPVLLTISMGFFMPSLADMEGFELFGNMAALTILVVTVMVNICIQMSTGVIFSFFIPEHAITLVVMFLILVAMWYASFFKESAMLNLLERLDRPRGRGELTIPTGSAHLEARYATFHILDPQWLICMSTQGNVYGAFLCLLSLVVVLEACVRTFFLSHMDFCGGESDYKWSMWLIVTTQILLAVIGFLALLVRSFYLPVRSGMIIYSRGSTENLKDFKIVASVLIGWRPYYMPFKFARKGIMKIFRVLRACLVIVLFVNRLMMGWTNQIVIFFVDLLEMHFSRNLSYFHEIGLQRIKEWKETCMEDHPSKLIHLLSSTPPQLHIEAYPQLESDGHKLLLLVLLVRILSHFTPSSHVADEILAHALDEIFDMLYFISERSLGGKLSRDIAKELWMTRDYSDHWFQKHVLKPYSEPSKDILNCAREVILAILRIQTRLFHKGTISDGGLLYVHVDQAPPDRMKQICISIIEYFRGQLPQVIQVYLQESPAAEYEKRLMVSLKYMYKIEQIPAQSKQSTDDGIGNDDYIEV